MDNPRYARSRKWRTPPRGILPTVAPVADSTALVVRKGIAVALLGVTAAYFTACRILPTEDYWIESHGEAALSQIAASPRGVDGIGGSRDVYHYPGDFAVPWRLFHRTAAKYVGASPRATYVLDEQGFISEVAANGVARRWDYSDRWHVTAVTADEQDQVYVIANARAWKVSGTELTPLPCAGAVSAIGAASRRVYVVSPDGALSIADGGECKRMDAPGAVTSVGAFGDRLAVVVGGRAYRRLDGRWRKLSLPVRYRSTAQTLMQIAEVTLSANCLWVRDTEGFVYVLSEAS
jgi:hypothetical protein